MACSALFRYADMIAHPPPTMLCAPSEHVGESMYPRFKNRGIIAPPHPLFFSKQSPRLDSLGDEGHTRGTIVGAGLAGLAAGRDLARAGLNVHLLEKSRGVAGRASSASKGFVFWKQQS